MAHRRNVSNKDKRQSSSSCLINLLFKYLVLLNGNYYHCIKMEGISSNFFCGLTGEQIRSTVKSGQHKGPKSLGIPKVAIFTLKFELDGIVVGIQFNRCKQNCKL